jgi:uncharacterized protein (DUF433 family)
MQFPTLELADIYAVIAYDWNHQTAVDEHMIVLGLPTHGRSD